MKQKLSVLFTLVILFNVKAALAQNSNLIIFSEDGYNFTLFVNGEAKNTSPSTHVKVTGLSGDGCQVRINFKDMAIPEISKYIMLTQNEEVTFGIRKNKKGAYALRMVSTGAATSEGTLYVSGTPSGAISGSGQSQNTKQETQTVTTNSTDNATLSMQFSANEGNQVNTENMSISVSGSDMNTSMSMSVSNNSINRSEASHASSRGNNQYGQYKNKKGFCSSPGLDAKRMVKVKTDIQANSLDLSKDPIIRKVAKENCITSSQAAEMIKLLSLDQVKYNVGTYIFQFVYDPSNYDLVSSLIGDLSLRGKLDDFVLDYLKSENTNEQNLQQTSGQNGNVTINVNLPSGNNSVSSSYTSTLETTSTDVSTSNNGGGSYSNSCIMSQSDYENALTSVQSKTFADTKMSVAKQTLKNKCISVDQVIGIAKLFTYEEDKLQFVKYAYPYTSDKDNFYRVGNIFEYESTVEELNEFIDSNN